MVVQCFGMRRAFTLVELLVCIAILAVLAGILLPVFLTAKRKALEAQCIQGMRQIGVAVDLYKDDNDARLPERLSSITESYVNDKRLLVCPLDPQSGHHETTSRLEGDTFLTTGVSYTWTPGWSRAQDWGWWNQWPDYGDGKWRDATPISECHWHWAKKFHVDWEEDRNKGRGANAVLLLKDGSIRFWPGKRNVKEYLPLTE